MSRQIGLALALGALADLATGLTMMRQDEVGVVRRLGAVLAEPWGPGPHWGLDRVKPGQTRTLTVGASDLQAAPLTQAPEPSADDFLTGDLNLVTARAIVQYRVLKPVDDLFAARSADEALSASAESALTRALAGRPIDDIITTGRAEVAERMMRILQAEADDQGLGASIRAVRLGRIAPPVSVAPAFADAARARSDRRQAMITAEGYRDRAQADARSRAREVADHAAARYNRLVQVARGEADRFAKVLAEARKSSVATRRRLYLEALAERLPHFARKVVVASGQDLDISLIADDARANPAPAEAEKGRTR